VRSANASAWVADDVFAGQEGDQAFSSSPNRECCHTLGVHVVQGCAQALLALARVGFRARRLIEVMRNFLYEMIFSNDRSTDNYVDAAVDHLSV
jgi:hypothetical protein